MKGDSLAQCHETLLYDVSLGFGEGSSTRQPIDGVQHGVDHDCPVIAASKQRGTFGDERQHSRTQVAVQRKGHLCGAESNLVKDRDSSISYVVWF